MTTTYMQSAQEATAEVVGFKVAMLTAQKKLIEDQLARAKADFIATGIPEVVLSDGTKVAAIDSPTRDFDQPMLQSILTVEAFNLITKTTVSAEQFDAVRKVGKIPAEADAAVSFNDRTIVKVTKPAR